MRRLSYGIGIGVRRASVLVRDRDSIVWAKEIQTGAGESLAEVLTELLLAMPRQRFVRPAACVAIGPALAQLKPLANLPQTSDARIVAGIVKESPHVFFLDSAGLISGSPWRSPNGQWWGSALDAAVVASVLQACTDAHVGVRGFVPAAAVLSHSIRNDTFVWQDADVCVRVSTDTGTITETVRQRSCTDGGCVEFVAPLADHGSPFSIADAWGAASMSVNRCPVLVPDSHAASTSLRGIRTGATALLLAVAAAIILPVTTAAIPARRLETRLVAWRERAADAEMVDRQVQRVSAVLTEAAEFDASRISMTALLDDIAANLADAGALESLSIATGEPLTLTITSDQMPSVLALLGTIRGVTNVGTSGAVEWHMSEHGPVQRVTVHARLNAAERRAPDVGGES